MKRIISVLSVMAIMVAMLVAAALPAFADGGAAANCGPPGQTHSDYAKDPGKSTVEARGEPPGQGVREDCAPGHQRR
jgi:hypothetical protein